jgi:hypothetical protein
MCTAATNNDVQLDDLKQRAGQQQHSEQATAAHGFNAACQASGLLASRMHAAHWLLCAAVAAALPHVAAAVVQTT